MAPKDTSDSGTPNSAEPHSKSGSATSSGDTNKSDKVHIVIVGCGPAGLLLAFYLLERGAGRFQVSIFESREDLRVTAKRERNARRYSLVLAYRGKKVLARIPGLLDAIREISIPSDELYLHVGKYVGARAFKLAGVPPGVENADDMIGLNVDRADLCAAMLSYLMERHGDSGLLSVHFFKKCTAFLTSIDFQKREALFEDVKVNIEAQGNEVNVIPGQDTCQATTGAPLQRVPYDLVVGADGVNSAVRHSFTLLPRGFDCSVTDQFSRAYILHVRRPPEISPSGFNLVPKIPDAQSFRCLFYPSGQKAESINLALIWPVNDPPVEFLAMKDPAEMTSWLRQRLPFLDLQESAAQDILAQRVAQLRMVKCEPYHHSEGGAVLIGDAAHATPPAIGQGCNSSLVDAAVLARLLLGESVGEDDRLETKGMKDGLGLLGKRDRLKSVNQKSGLGLLGKLAVGEDHRLESENKKDGLKVHGEAVGGDDRLEAASAKASDAAPGGRTEILERLPRALARYSALQVPEGHALVDCSDAEGPLDARVGFWHALRRFVTGALWRLFPWLVSPPIMFMAGFGANFSDVRRIHAGQIEKILASNERVKAQWREAQAKKVLAGGV
ncbi:hypothetical protein KFL_005670020 [Klebsormidium nitens]|uniref:FAD-binding domain-containing protein n=1 Tax=Klebsormidium nitens TaxID=105231 RepID=A0A1Y1INY8_KLENI|nr:hypothetical protein KFL_005670020 [Klebsormidium nitens]|eukprot:GAQ89828.1 hypothetical protein KFL_005670020 [Klebsormidium nitens]